MSATVVMISFLLLGTHTLLSYSLFLAGGFDAGENPALYEPSAAASPIIDAAKVAKLPSVA